MGIFSEFREQNHNFWRYFWKYSQIIILIQLFINYIFVPILNYLANGIIFLGNVKYISYTNILYLITKKPLVVIGLIILLLLILLLVFTQFTFLLISFQAIKSKASLSWWEYLKRVSKNVLGLPFKAFGFFLLYFLIITPFGTLGISSTLLNKVKIPQFILDWLIQEHLPLAILLIIVYFLVVYIGLRWLFVLPLMIFENKPIKVAIRRSWSMTHGKAIYYLGVFLILMAVISVVGSLLTSIVIGLQWVIDYFKLFANFDFTMAVFNMTLIQFINIIISIYAAGVAVLIMLSQTHTHYFYPKQSHRSHKWFWGILGVSAIVAFFSYNSMYFNDWLLTPPVTVSHRGVDDGNGVQNSISAMKATSKENPTYIEMDVQETKDHQFVVYHDNTLKGLAGINKRPSQLTLAQLKKIKIHENGKTAHIASFDDYLTASEKMDQKLLVEFKAVSGNSKNFVKLFSQKYGARMLEDKNMVHSLSYKYIEQSKDYMPKVKASYILSFNLAGIPISKANDFTMEYTTLNQRFIDGSHLQNKKVFAWTANDEESMDHMIFLGADGVITDNLSVLNSEIKRLFDKDNYSERMLSYVTQMQDPFN
ncbi:glycerophosphodiester phosphodiesterase [Companilactobacillus sp. HBUAS59544]|uniref:glycerophosphodiester phosphodiesterase n=1 Tax=Companilactobacillus sp. HBUAS59544 TaxID=3109363 RepID=UPI002FEEA30F